MYNDTVKLVPTTRTVNSMGDPIDTDGTKKEVFCRVKSYSLKDKFMARNDGEVPELLIVLADKLEYSDEKFVEYKNIRYEVVGVTFNDTANDIGLAVRRWQTS